VAVFNNIFYKLFKGHFVLCDSIICPGTSICNIHLKAVPYGSLMDTVRGYSIHHAWKLPVKQQN